MVDVFVKGAAQDLKARAERDTGVFAREILGYNYEKNEKTGEKYNVGRGGIYKTGPHKQIVDLFDDDEAHYKQAICSRKGRKTSLVISRICRRICQRPNVRIMYSMRIQGLSKKTVDVCARELRTNPKIQDLWGEQYHKDFPYSRDGIIVATRTDTAMRDYTLWPSSLESGVTGDHPDEIWLDDLADWINCKDEEQIQKQIDYLQLCFPLLEHGGYLCDVGTPYDEADVHHYIRNELSSQFKCLWIGTGMEMVQRPNGKWELEGTPIWPHFTVPFLEGELERLKPYKFSAQMQCEVMAGDLVLFNRDQFHPDRYDPAGMRFLNGYILTDTAATDKTGSSYGVIGVVLIGSDDTRYLADLRVGLWKPSDFVAEFFNTLMEWRAKCRMVGQVFEHIGLNQVYRSMIEERARQIGVPLNLMSVRTGVDKDRKKRHISALQPIMAAGQFRVLDTVPRHVTIEGRTHSLWDPLGHRDEHGNDHPSGMLVDQFIRPNVKRKDIPDALALMECVDERGKRYCQPSPMPHFQRRDRGANLPDDPWRRGSHAKGPDWSDLRGRAQPYKRRFR